MTTGIQERDDEVGPARLALVVSGPPQVGDPVSLGDLVSLVVADAAVKMRGNFNLPRIVALTIREEEDRQSR